MVCILGADMISVASNIHWPFQHVRATRSSLFRKWKRAHSESALSQYTPDLLHNATREEISGNKPLLLVIIASQLCVAL